MVLGSACVLSAAKRRQIALERHKRRERELKIGESEAFRVRKEKIEKNTKIGKLSAPGTLQGKWVSPRKM